MQQNRTRFWDLNLLLALTCGAVVWGLADVSRSLWIDEFHCLDHASAPGLQGLLAQVSRDNHPPLYFVILWVMRNLLGESPVALRLASNAFGFATVVLGARFAQRLPSAASRRWVPWLIVLSSYSLMIFTEARMYGLLALSVLGLTHSIVRAIEGRSAWPAAFWIVVGLHTHYYFLYYGFALNLGACAVACRSSDARNALRRLFVPALVGVLLFVPWAATGFVEQLQHALPSGGSAQRYLNLSGLIQSFAHLLFFGASLGGEWASHAVSAPGSAIGVLLGVLGLLALYRNRDQDRGCSLPLLFTAAFVAPLVAFAIACVYPRASYLWRYIAGSCVPVLMLIACGMSATALWRRCLSVAFVAALAIVTGVVALSPGREDFRGAYRVILENAKPGDAILVYPLLLVSKDEKVTGWNYYKDRIEVPGGAARPVEYRLEDYRRAFAHDRVWAVIRYRYPQHVISELDSAFASHQVTKVGQVMTTHLWSR